MKKNKPCIDCGRFIWNEPKRKYCRKCAAKYNPTVFKKGHSFNEETRKKISESVKKNPNRYWLGKKLPPHVVKAISDRQRGRKLSVETRRKLSEGSRGEKGNNWQGGKTKEIMKLRHGLEYKLWREAVFERDNWTCIWCNKRGCYLEADHIKPFSLYPELRFAIDNGRTLCKDCHSKTDTYKYKSSERGKIK